MEVAEATITQGPETVLVVDDDEIHSKLMVACVKKAGYESMLANSGNAALEIIEKHDVDLVLLDNMMPGLDGMQVLKITREKHSRQHLPILMVTGSDETEDLVGAFDAGANDYVLKPVNYLGLMAIIRTHLDLRRSVLRLEQFNHDLEAKVEERTRELRKQIDETRDAEEALRQARKLEAVGQLAAGIAHEINTPMQFIHDNAQFLESAFGDLLKLQSKYGELLHSARHGDVPESLFQEIDTLWKEADADYLVEEIPAAFSEARDGIERVTRIVRAMKEFAHPGGEKKQPVDLNKVVESTVMVSTNEWKYVANIETNLDESLPQIQGFTQELGQALLNLIVNAAHAIETVVGDGSNSKGTVSISTKMHGDFVELRVGDSGCGIPDDIADRVFDPFFTTKQVGKGTGQGLAIAYSIIKDKHGGEIEFDSDDTGTTFTIRLPMNDDGKARSH